MRFTLAPLGTLVLLSVVAAVEPLSCPESAELQVLDGPQGKVEFCATESGQLHGPAREWYANGQQRTRDNWSHGKSEGLWIVWDERGQKREERMFKNGVQDGAETFWFGNGQLKNITCWKAGKRDGPVAEWAEDGGQVVSGQHENDVMEGDWFFRSPVEGLAIRVPHANGKDGPPVDADFPELEASRITKFCS